MKEKKQTINPKKQRQPDPSMMYSAMMEDLRLTFGLENPTTQQQSTKDLPTTQDNTLEVTFLNLSKKGKQT